MRSAAPRYPSSYRRSFCHSLNALRRYLEFGPFTGQILGLAVVPYIEYRIAQDLLASDPARKNGKETGIKQGPGHS